MKALSIRAPWWWFILYAGKPLENRTWNCHIRGPIAIHASSWWNESDVIYDFLKMERILRDKDLWSKDFPKAKITEMKALGGYVVGTTEITGCVQESDSPWFFGPNGIVLANSKPIAEPFKFKGKLSFFEVPLEVG